MKQRFEYLQWLRCFAAAAVVFMHTAANKWNSIPFVSYEWDVLNTYDSLVRWPVPVFIMITGAIFLPRQTDLRDILKKYLPRLVIAYLVWCGIYTLAAWDLGMSVPELPNKFLSGHYHLWYLPFLWGVYLAIPFVQQIVRDRRLTMQLLAVSFVIGIAVPWLADLAVLVLPGKAQMVRLLEGKLGFSFFLDHLFFLVLDHVLHQWEIPARLRRCIYAAGLLGVGITAAATHWASGVAGIQNSVFYDFTAPNNICAAAALFVFAKYHLHSLPKITGSLANASFGIYLMHPLVIEWLADRGVHVIAYDPWIAVPVLSALILALCWLVSAMLARIPVIGKYLV